MPPPERLFWPKVRLWAGVLAPAVLFYALLTRGYINIPNADDYPAILEFAYRYVHQTGFAAKFLQILTFQQSEYKTMLVNGLTALQCELLHRVSLPVFIFLGNSLPVGIFFAVLAMCKRKIGDPGTTLLHLLPVSLLLFQLQYGSTLDWATAGMQNLPVILCSLLAILFLARNNSRRSLVVACVWLVLAVCSSANGFGLALVGGLLLLHRRRVPHLLVWAATAAGMAAIYSYKYNFHSSQAVPGATVGQAFLHFNLLYAISFLGTSVAGFTSPVPSIAFGFLCLCFFVYICATGYAQRNLAAFYAMVFVVASGFGVAGLRGALGVTQSLASRYRIYSNLLLALFFIYCVEEVLPRMRWTSPMKRNVLAGVNLVALLFCLGSDWAGLHFIEGRKVALRTEMARWEHPGRAADSETATNPALARQLRLGIYKPIEPYLSRAMQLDLYKPPVL